MRNWPEDWRWYQVEYAERDGYALLRTYVVDVVAESTKDARNRVLERTEGHAVVTGVYIQGSALRLFKKLGTVPPDEPPQPCRWG